MADWTTMIADAAHVLPLALPALLVGYFIFGMTGFGTALIAAPVLAHAMPVAAIVPMLALLDCAAAATAGVRLSDKVSKQELLRLVPLMVVGTMIGATLLLYIPARPMLLTLGIFVVCYALYGLWAPAPKHHLAAAWSFLFGTVGGVFSAMFGSGGPIYAMYLSRRLSDKDAMRATQTTLIGLATFTRAIIFAIAGLYSDWSIPLLVLMLLPIMFAGITLANRVAINLSREKFLRVLHIVLIGSGLSLIVRALTAATL
jgi:uncharacterized membrane protein YfcA